MTSSHPTHKPAELFRSDLITAMKLPDSTPLEAGSFLAIREAWRTEWEFGVQVCVSPGHIQDPQSSKVTDLPQRSKKSFNMPSSKLTESHSQSEYPIYDLDELDLNWLETVNQKRKFKALAGANGLTEDMLRNALIALETKCQQNMARAIATEESLGIEYDELTVCDVCQDHESEDSNDMIFCDVCNVCVHQACYGVSSVPEGTWVCKVCSSGEKEAPVCALCHNRGGALKRVRPGSSGWAHISCALWIPEVRVGNVDKMEPITNIDAVPMSRWNLTCCLCKKKQGACVQCCHPSCVSAYHVTCGFKNNLFMKSRLDMVNNTVIHESFCPKHSALHRSPHSSPNKSKQRSGAIHQPSQLIQLQETFFKYTSPGDLASELHMGLKLSNLIYNYWKLKRRSQHNRTLLSHLPIETSLESVRAELAGGSRRALREDKDFMRIVHLRQNLEKARNLIYMVQRRERLKKQLLYNMSSQWDMEVSTSPTPSANYTEELDCSPRQTRSMSQRLPESCPVSEEPTLNGRHSHSTQSQTSSNNPEPAHHSSTIHKANSPIPTKDSTDTSELECTVANTLSTRNKLTNSGPSVNGAVENSLFKVGRTKVEGLVMRNGRGPLLRHRPYSVNDKATPERSL